MADDLSFNAFEAGVNSAIGVKPSKEKPSSKDAGKTSSDFQTRLEAAKIAYKAKYGKDMPITSQTRTRAEQQKLYDDWKAGKSGIYTPINPADYPNRQTFHQEAADIPTSVPEDFLRQHGLHRPLGEKDPVHAVVMPNFKPQKAAEPTTAPSSELDFSAFESAVNQAAKPTITQTGKVVPSPVPESKNILGSTGRTAAGFLETLIGGIQSLPGMAVAETGYATGRALQGLGIPIDQGRLERGRANIYKQFVEPYTRPVGTTFGVTETPEYKSEASQQLMNFIGENINKGADWISQKTGIPKADIENMIATTGIAVGPAAGRITGRVATGTAGALDTATGKIVSTGKAIKREVMPTTEMQAQLERKKLGYGPTDVNAPAGSVGAAGVTKQSQIAQLSSEASPELMQYIQKLRPEDVNVDALNTRILEEKYGIDLTKGQRTNNRQQYSQEWNNRGAHPTTLGAKFEAQPQQFASALDQVRDKVAPDIYESNPAELGQKIINSFVEKDNLRKQNIENLYGDLQAKYNDLRQQNGLAPTEDLPINGNDFVNSARKRLSSELLTHDAESAGLTKFLDAIEANGGKMTFQDYVTLDRRLSAKMREGKGSERAAAYEMRQALQNMELSDDAAVLKPLLDKAKAAAAERFETIRTVPGYKQAIGEATSAKDAMEGIGSPSADTFHNKFISRGSPADIKRILREVGENSEAHQAMRVAELNNIKEKAGFKGEKANFTPNGMNDYLYSQREKLNDIFGPEGAKSLYELNLLGSKIAQPKTGTFNYSNTLAAAIQEMAGQGITTGLESWAAAKTGGLSVPVTRAGKEWFANAKHKKFGEKASAPYSGISTKD